MRSGGGVGEGATGRSAVRAGMGGRTGGIRRRVQSVVKCSGWSARRVDSVGRGGPDQGGGSEATDRAGAYEWWFGLRVGGATRAGRWCGSGGVRGASLGGDRAI